MDIAIQVQPILLGNERVIFKPIGVLKGAYDDKSEIFMDEYGYEYNKINGTSMYDDRYFCCPTTLEELREVYSEEDDDTAILDEFLSNFMDLCFIGFFDDVSGTIKIIEINFAKIAEDIANDEYDLGIDLKDESLVEFDLEDNQRFVFDLKALKELKNYQTVEEIRDYIDKLISVGEYIKETVSKERLEQDEPKSKLSLKKEESRKFDLAKLRKEVLANIVGQDEAIKDLTRVIAINQTSKNPKNKSHILITGPSGTGKTEMVNIIAKELDLPVFKADATSYTKVGYYGKDVPTMLTGLVDAADGDIEKAQNGILIIDEIDKTVSYTKDQGFGKAVLHALLKILDREIIEVEVEKARNQKIMFDTSNLTVIAMGSFDELYEQKQQNKKNVIGFDRVNIEETSKVRLEEEDLIKWMGPEFIGRIGTITSTDELTHKNVLKILKESKLSQLKIAEQDFAERGIKFTYTSGYLDEIAKKGYSKKLGVRKLNKTVKKSLDCAYDEILTNPKIKTLKLTKKTALDNKEYYVEC